MGLLATLHSLVTALQGASVMIPRRSRTLDLDPSAPTYEGSPVSRLDERCEFGSDIQIMRQQYPGVNQYPVQARPVHIVAHEVWVGGAAALAWHGLRTEPQAVLESSR